MRLVVYVENAGETEIAESVNRCLSQGHDIRIIPGDVYEVFCPRCEAERLVAELVPS